MWVRLIDSLQELHEMELRDPLWWADAVGEGFILMVVD